MSTSHIEAITIYLQKKIGKVITSSEIESLQKEVLGSGFNENKFYKLIYTLKNKGMLLELKSGLYVVSYPESQDRHIESLKENYYWPLLYDILKSNYKSSYYIGGKKGLELHLNNYEIPEEIDIIISFSVPKKQLIMSGASMLTKGVSYAHPQNTLKQMEKLIHSKSSKVSISGKVFLLGTIELCILETLYYNTKGSTGMEVELVKKAIKKFRTKLDMGFIKTIIQGGKYHTSLNRLYSIAKTLDKDFSDQIFEIIKSDGFRIAV